MWFKMKLKWCSAMWCLLHILNFGRVDICKNDFFMTHNIPNPQTEVQWSFYSERRFMGHTVILQYLNIQQAASRSTCYYVFRKSSIWRCCKSRHVTKQDVLQLKNSKKINFKSLLCMCFKNHSLLGFKHPSLDFRSLLCMDLKNLHSRDLKILLSLDFSILLWISKVLFAWI